MLGILSAAALGYVALGVFVPLFVIGIIMLKSIRRAFVLAIVFAGPRGMIRVAVIKPQDQSTFARGRFFRLH